MSEFAQKKKGLRPSYVTGLASVSENEGGEISIVGSQLLFFFLYAGYIHTS